MLEVAKAAQEAIRWHENGTETIRFSECLTQSKLPPAKAGGSPYRKGYRWVTTSSPSIVKFFLACWNNRHELAKEIDND